MSTVVALSSSLDGWLRFCKANPAVRTRDYLDGYVLLSGPYAADWLRRGFDALLQTIQNGVLGA